MKRNNPAILLLFSMTTALCLTGCGSASLHAKAIEAAVVAYSDYYIEVRDLSGQVKEQYQRLYKQQSAIDYTITVSIPDYSTVDPAAVGFTAPALDYATMSASQYRAAAQLSLRQSLEAYAYDNTLSSYLALPVMFSLTETGDGVSAAMYGTSRNAIKKTVDAMVEPLLDSYDDYSENHRLAAAADARFELLRDLFGDDYIALSDVQAVNDDGGGAYRLTLVYPDPVALFAALAEQYYASFNQPFYGDARTVTLDAGDLSGIDTAGMELSVNEVTVFQDAETGVFSLADASAVESQLSAARAFAEETTAQRVNEEWRVPEVEAPSSGSILEGKSSGNEIVFVSDAELGKYYYIRFYLLPGDDASEEGTLTAGMFLVGGKRATVRLPSGYYRIACYIGDRWYGLDSLFGPDGTTFDAGNAVRSRSGYINTISFE